MDGFDENDLKLLIEARWKDCKGTKPVFGLVADYVNLYCIELLERAKAEAVKEGAESIAPKHIQKVLIQFLLDMA